jgi:hypothetical protein
MADQPEKPSRAGLAMLAEFAEQSLIITAARALREAGYQQLDALTPRPVEELQAIIAPERSTLPRTVFVAGVLGACTALGVEWFCNAWDYPINVGGRPPFSLPAFIPITFELMVLFAGVTAFFAVLHRMHLPWLSNPVFDAPGIESASSDRFWLVVNAESPDFDPSATQEKLLGLGAAQVVMVAEDPRAVTAFQPHPKPAQPEGASS